MFFGLKGFVITFCKFALRRNGLLQIITKFGSLTKLLTASYTNKSGE